MIINKNDYCNSLNEYISNCTEQEKQQIKEMPILFLILYTIIFNIFITLFGGDND